MSRARAAAAGVALLLYLLIPTRNYYWDGIAFAQTIEDAKNIPYLIHPNHIAYNILGWLVYRALGGGVRALYVLQGISAVFGSLAVWLLFGIVARVVRTARAALLLTAIFALSGTWWRFATDADAYVPSVAMLLACAAVLLGDRPRPVAAALLQTAAILLHQIALLFVPAAILVLWRPRRVATYLGVAGPLSLAAYAAAYRASTGGFDRASFVPWMATRASDASFTFNLVRNTAISVRSWVQLFFSGRPFLVRYSDWLSIALLALLAAALATLLVSLRILRPEWKIDQPVLFRFSLAWFAAYAIFLFFWLPQNTFYKLFGLPPLILMLACVRGVPSHRLFWPSLAAVISLFNLTFAIIPYSRATANPAVEFAQHLSLPAGSVVYYQSVNSDGRLARYFNPQSQWRNAESTGAIDGDLAQGRPVWLETTAIDRFAQTDPEWFARHTDGAPWRQLVDDKRRIRFVALSPAATKP